MKIVALMVELSEQRLKHDGTWHRQQCAHRLEDVEAALTFLEGQRQQRGSHVVIDLIIRAAKRSGWKSAICTSQSTQS
jgi:hypothetical protein